MFSLGNSIKSKLALAAAVVAAGALAVPSAASAVTAGGCPIATDCKFVGGTGHNAATDTGGATQFRVNTSPFATTTCTNSRATVVTESPASDVVTTTLQFTDCMTAGLGTVVTCLPSSVTLSSGGSGSGTGPLTLSKDNCTINVSNGLCVIKTSNTVGGQNVLLNATGATGAKSAQITAGIAGNTDALTFNASGPGCGLIGAPATGAATFSNDPNSGAITYDEVPSTSNGLVIS